MRGEIESPHRASICLSIGPREGFRGAARTFAIFSVTFEPRRRPLLSPYPGEPPATAGVVPRRFVGDPPSAVGHPVTRSIT